MTDNTGDPQKVAGCMLTKEQIHDLAKEAGYPLFVYRGELHTPPYIEKLMRLAYEQGQRDLTQTQSHG
jgi:hypothetical protein